MNEIHDFLNKLAATEDMTLGQFLMNIEHDLQEDGDTGVSLNRTTVGEYIKDLDSLGSEQDKVANEIYSFLEKTAASFDARRNKQYWQMLKRMYGGTDEAVAAIKESGDTGIWHGTRAELIDKIEQEGLKVGPFREFGKGTFFGDKRTAGYYSDDQVRSSSTGALMGSIYEDGRSIHNPDEMIAWVKANPNQDKYKLSEGSLLRLAKPSELRGTDTLYPKVENLKVFGVKEHNDLKKVAPSQTHYMAEHDDGIQRVLRPTLSKIKNGSPEGKRKELERLVRRDFDNYTPDQENLLQEDVDYLLDMAEKAPVRFKNQIYKMMNKERNALAEQLMVTRNDKELNQLKYYGKLRGRRVFDRIGTDHRAEMFYDNQGIPNELLRREDGSSFGGKNSIEPVRKYELMNIEEPISKSNEEVVIERDGKKYVIPLAVAVAGTLGLGNLYAKKRRDDRNESNL